MAAARPVCLHCERRPPTAGLGLCPRCYRQRNIRRLYIHRRGWTPQWELHLRRLAERAKQRLPLFNNDPPGVVG
jgi:hypothetical protein